MGLIRRALKIRGPSLKEKFRAAIGGPAVAASIHAGPTSFLQFAAANLLASKKAQHALGRGFTQGFSAGIGIGGPLPSVFPIIGGILGAALPKESRPVANAFLEAIGSLGGGSSSGSGGIGGIIGSIGGLIQGQQLVKSQKALAKAQVRALDRLSPGVQLPGMGIPGAVNDIFNVMGQGGPQTQGGATGSWPDWVTRGPATMPPVLRKSGRGRLVFNQRTGQWVQRRRHMNPVNFHALKRAGRRIHSFMKLVRPFLTYERKKTVRSTFRLRAGARRKRK